MSRKSGETWGTRGGGGSAQVWEKPGIAATQTGNRCYRKEEGRGIAARQRPGLGFSEPSSVMVWGTTRLSIY
jgi:hypothetical protein